MSGSDTNDFCTKVVKDCEFFMLCPDMIALEATG